MQINPNITLSGQQPNILGAMAGGQEMAQAQIGRQNENALNRYVQQNAGGIMGGDQNALAGMAGLGTQGLSTAMGVQGAQLDQANVRGAMQDREARLQLAYEQSALQAQQIMQTMTQAEREAERAALEQSLAAATQIQDPQTWERIMTEMGQPELAGRFEDRDILIASALATKDALSMGAPAGPQSADGKFYADQAAGFIPEGATPGAGVNVNLNGQGDVGTIPQGYMLIADPEAPGGRRMIQIAGGPEDTSAATANASANAATGSVNVLEVLDNLKTAVETNPGTTTGFVGRALANVAGTGAYDAARTTETIKANLAFDALAAMRAASPTGGALGAVSERELTLLESQIANLDLGQSTEAVLGSIERIERQYTRILQKAYETGDPAALDGLLGGRPSFVGGGGSATTAATGGLSPEALKWLEGN